MTSTINGNHPSLTVSDDALMRVRAHGSPLGTPKTPRERDAPTYTRVIPDGPPTDQVFAAARKTVSLHVTEAGDAWRGGWFLNEAKPTLAEVAKLTLPAKGEAGSKGVWLAMSAAGLFRTAAFTVGYLLEAATTTRVRAGVALLLTVFTTAIVAVAHLLV